MALEMLQRHRGAVAPAPPTARAGNNAQSLDAVTKAQLMGAVFNWLLCLLLMFLLLSQFLTIVLSTSVHNNEVSYGRDPGLGPSAISGFNDEPYSDRILLCRRRGRRFGVISVNEALSDPATIVEDTTGANVNGYRVVKRAGMTVSDDTRRSFVNTCSRLNATMERIFSICNGLGYSNVTRDSLRIVDDVNSSTLFRIPKTLPVLIMPFWDNAPSARYVIPGWDGHACMFRLGGTFEVSTAANAYLIAVNRTVRETKTVEWLSRPGGIWKNGWYEDTQGMRWYSDVFSINSLKADGFASRHFDMIGMEELNCAKKESDCALSGIENRWGNLVLMSSLPWFDSVAISNGNRFGLFLVKGYEFDLVTCAYNISSFTSDLSFASLLLQWMLSMIAVQRGFFKRVSAWHNTDIGCIANSYTYGILTITTLPRMKMILAAYFTVGCEFEGSQRALSDAWFVIYPAIVNIVLLQSSVVNLLARIFRRRMVCWHIPVTIMLLSFTHWIRAHIGSSKWFGFDGRVSTLVSSEEFDSMSLFEMTKPSTSIRLNGNFKALFALKLFALSLNVLSLVFSEDMSVTSKRSQSHEACPSEKSLCVRACNVGGLGRSGLYEWGNCSTGPRLMLNSYELVRLGYIVVGNTYLMSWESWARLAVMSSLSRIRSWRNHRLLVFDVVSHVDRSFSISTHPQLINLSDPRLLCLKWWDIDSRALF